MKKITEYAEVCQGMIRHLHSDLTVSEFKVLLFVVERTLRFGKSSENIPYRHFLEGIITKSKDVLVHPISITRQSLSSALKSLEAKGLIRRSPAADQRRANLITVIVRKIKEAIMSARDLFINKTYDKSSENRNKKVVKKEHYPQSKKSTTNKYKNKEHEKVNSFGINAESQDSSIEAIVERAKQNTQAKMEQVAKKATYPTNKNVKAIWNLSLTTHYKDQAVPHLSAPDAGRLRNNMKNIRFGKESWITVMQWALENWAYLKHHKFTWMSKKPMPDTPDFFFFSSHIRYFAEYFFADSSQEDYASTHKAVQSSAKDKRRIRSLEEENDRLSSQLRRAKQGNKEAVERTFREKAASVRAEREKRAQKRKQRTEQEIDSLINGYIPSFGEL